MSAAQRRAENAVKMPEGILQDMLARAVREATFTIAKEMAPQILDIRKHSEHMARMVEADMIIRSDNQGYMASKERIDTGDIEVTFEFPAFRWTQMLERHMLEDMMGRAGPVHMPDRPIHVMEGHRNPLPFNGMSGPDTVSFETI